MQLNTYLERKGLTQTAFAELIGATQGRVGQLLNGELPSFRLATRIHEETSGAVSYRDWPCNRDQQRKQVA